jgi:hypothetical protein
MFHKNFVLLILPFCLQCNWNDLSKNKKDIASKVEPTNTDPNGVLRNDEEYSSATVNDESNIFSDDIKRLRIKKETYKVKDDGETLFNNDKKKLLDNSVEHDTLKNTFIKRIFITAKKYFIRHLECQDSEFKNKLNSIFDQDKKENENNHLENLQTILDIPVEDEQTKQVCDVFKKHFNSEGRKKFAEEFVYLKSQYISARNFIEKEKFDS